jgi:hypothetical protein
VKEKEIFLSCFFLMTELKWLMGRTRLLLHLVSKPSLLLTIFGKSPNLWNRLVFGNLELHIAQKLCKDAKVHWVKFADVKFLPHCLQTLITSTFVDAWHAP